MEPERVTTLSIHNSSILENSSLDSSASESAIGVGVNVTMQPDQDGIYMNFTCTSLSRLSLMDVFTRMDIGNTEYWGNVSVTWLAFFIVYYVLFSIMILLLIMACIYVYFIKRFHIFPWI